MSAFLIPKIQKFDLAKLRKGTFLMIINADKKPPHIALMVDSKVYSLTVKGRQVGDPLEVFIKAILRNCIKTLFIEISPNKSYETDNVVKLISTALMEFEKVEPGKITCLNPIKSFFNSVYQVDTKEVSFVFDLLPQLYSMRLINAVYQLNLDTLLNGQDYYLEKYSMADVNSRIIEIAD